MGVRKITADKGSLDAHALCKAHCPKESYTENKGEYQIYHRANALSYSDTHYTDYTGKRKQPRKATGLPVKGNKKRAEQMLMELRKSFVVPEGPTEDLEIHEGMLFTEFMRAWLEVVRTTVVPTTFGGYQTTVEKKFIPYFEKKNLALANVQAKDLQTFYLHEMKTLAGL